MRKKIAIGIGIFLLLFLALFGKALLKAISFSPVLFHVVFNKEISLTKTESQTINLLVLGIGGGIHEGPDLSDTIIFASLDPIKNKITLISLPRDLWVSPLQGKINIAYAFGKGKKEGGGLVLSKAAVSKVSGQPITYGIVVNFDGFVKAVDLVGGLDILVDRTFDDFEYPIEEKRDDLCGQKSEDIEILLATQSAREVFPCRYQTVYFEKGIEHMNGERTLIFVRSRYAKGVEGTDFARSQRQQKVIQAFKEKLFSLEIILNPIKVANLYSILEGSIDTDIKKEEFDDFIKLAGKMKQATIRSVVLETQEQGKKNGLLINPPPASFNGLWVLIPRAGEDNFSEIQRYVNCVLSEDACVIPGRSP